MSSKSLDEALHPWEILIRSEYEGTRLFKDHTALIAQAKADIERIIEEARIDEISVILGRHNTPELSVLAQERIAELKADKDTIKKEGE